MSGQPRRLLLVLSPLRPRPHLLPPRILLFLRLLLAASASVPHRPSSSSSPPHSWGRHGPPFDAGESDNLLLLLHRDSNDAAFPLPSFPRALASLGVVGRRGHLMFPPSAAGEGAKMRCCVEEEGVGRCRRGRRRDAGCGDNGRPSARPSVRPRETQPGRHQAR